MTKIQESKDPENLICSDSLSINRLALEQMNSKIMLLSKFIFLLDDQVKEFIQDGYAFASSFVLKQEAEDAKMSDEN